MESSPWNALKLGEQFPGRVARFGDHFPSSFHILGGALMLGEFPTICRRVEAEFAREDAGNEAECSLIESTSRTLLSCHLG
jgi:hypothetical protein